MKKLFLLFALSAVIGCEDKPDHQKGRYTEYLVTSEAVAKNDSMEIEWIDENERWQKQRVARDFHYDFVRQPFQKLEMKVTDLSGVKRRILARIYKKRETADYIDTTGKDLFLHLRDK